MRAPSDRVDLLRALARDCPVPTEELARLLGFQARSEEPKNRLPIGSQFVPLVSGKREETDPKEEEATVPPSLSARFWQPIARQYQSPRPEQADLNSPLAGDGPAMPTELPPWPSLSPRSHLLARLRSEATRTQPTGGPDILAAVRLIALAQQLDRVPRARRRQWGAAIQVIQDRSRRLVPLWPDQDELLDWLMPLFPQNSVDVWRCLDGPMRLLPMDNRNRHGQYQPPAAGAIVLVEGDLGCLDSRPQPLLQQWLEFGHNLRAAGCVPVALMPCAPDRWAPALHRVWHLIAWEGPQSAPSSNQDPAQQLLHLLSPAIRLEPGLLRQVRRVPGAGGFGVAAEVAVWQHGVITSQSSVAASLDADGANRQRAAFDQYPSEVRRAVLALIRDWRGGLSPDVWYEEILSLSPTSTALLPEPKDRDRAIQRFRNLGEVVPKENDPKRVAGFVIGLRGLLSRMPQSEMLAPEIREAMDRFVHFVSQWGENPVAGGKDLYRAIDPVHIAPNSGAVRRRVTVHHQGGHIEISPPDALAANGSPLTDITSVNGIISIAGTDLPDPRASFWAAGSPPLWASDWGYDRFGAWASFTIAGVTQRLRWIVPGRFLMGSPDDEPGRFDHEGPVHEVTISQGFWLFDTPCTQALWQAVMGENPSRFPSPDRPVEQVSWHDVQEFIGRINGMVPGLSLTLPTEAQWEYACRAGTQTALYTGPIEIIGENNAPALDPIAWYGGNCGRGFELKDGYDIRNWAERQFPDSKGGTHPVGLKAPNGWGLYDMLGNVWEWCADRQRNYGFTPLSDPIGEMTDGVFGSIRGGSWSDIAGNLRVSMRAIKPRSGRRDFYGFRCARGQGGAELSLPPSPRLAERRGGAGRTAQRPGAVIEVGTSVARVPLPTAPALIIRSDCEEVHLTQITRPDWASAIGRDRFGLWTRIDIEGATQRLRWIAPGRFLMGSPDDEPGRKENEGPVHEVTISQGFWLFDTPCTQALWRAVMGADPSFFKSPHRPVEQVSRNDVQGFLQRINDLVPGLSLSLPTEAQWEYACRAGTETALYTGPINIKGERNAPALNPIAWYGGNCGQGFELANGYGIADWPERQFPDSKGGTHPVGLKAPNGWGLSDMLGNVWEWCADGQREYTTAPEVDPIGPMGDGASRALRGGSCFSTARFVRAACRIRSLPDDRFDFIGFRCARGQGGAELSLPPSPRLAERRGGAGRTALRPAGKPPAAKKPKK